MNSVLTDSPGFPGRIILVTPTNRGNLLLGPDAQEIQDPSDLGTDHESPSFTASPAIAREALAMLDQAGLPLKANPGFHPKRRTIDAVKRRTRAGKGACQGAFCGPWVRSLVAEIADIDENSVTGPSRDRDSIRSDFDEMRRLLND